MSLPDPKPQPLLRPARAQALQQRVSTAILDAAAQLLSRGGQASMSDVADAAGVARATVYRYFPNRQALLDALARAAVADAAARLASARIDQVPLEEGVRRAVRALVEVGDYFVVVARERVRPEPEAFEEGFAAPVRRLFERGQKTGDVRADVPATWLAEALVGCVVSVLAARPARGREDTIAAIAGILLDGVRRDRSSLA
jgi:TetR/AcrR family transcriptional regulator, mexCD-oprJ operon repressor